MVAPLDTQTNPDLVTNSNEYLFVRTVEFDTNGGLVYGSSLVDLGGATTTITDKPNGTGVGAAVTDNTASNNNEASGESIGIVSGAFKDYISNTLGYSAGYQVTYPGFSLAGDPIVAVEDTLNTGDITYFLMTDLENPTAGASLASPITATSQVFYYCFEKNTLISTPLGEVLVSKLNIGDEVLNTTGNLVKIKWIGRQTINPVFAKLEGAMPIKISAGALGNDLPTADLYVSPGHAMLVDGVLVHALALVNGSTITQVQRWSGDVEYFHIETENHELILANGAAAETFIDNVSRKEFDNWAEYDSLYPNAAPMIELDLPRVKFARQLPKAISDKLDTVAELINSSEAIAA